MIPAGRRPIGAEQAARINGMAPSTARAHKLFAQPGFPAPLTRGRRKRLWDEEQVRAYAAGADIPAITPAEPHPLDLLEREEAAEVWEVTAETYDYYLAEERAPEADVVIETRELWYRRTLLEYKRPGRGVGGGRPIGSRAPRVTGSKADRLAQVTHVLANADADTTTTQTIAQIIEVTGVSQRAAYELLREARQRQPTGGDQTE